MPEEKRYDEYEKAWMIPFSCPCCTRCWLYVDGRRAGTCFYHGPYRGYIQVEDSLSLES